jgi:nitroreductase
MVWELWDVPRRRKMVRSYRPDPVPREVLERVLGSVVHAPSAGFTQGNEFRVLSDATAVADFYRITDHPRWPMTDAERAVAAPVVVVPLANRDGYVARYSRPDKLEYGLDDPDRWPVPFWDIDCAMASMLILLSAIDGGLGSWFSGIFHGEQALLDHFGVPPSLRPRGVIFLGYATERDEFASPRDRIVALRRPASDLVHYGHW